MNPPASSPSISSVSCVSCVAHSTTPPTTPATTAAGAPIDRDGARQPDPAAETSAMAEFTGGGRGDLSGRNEEQNRAAGIDDPVAEGSRQGRQRYKADIGSPTDGDGSHSI